jgi:tetratricopeptide (TPR) repeat protein
MTIDNISLKSFLTAIVLAFSLSSSLVAADELKDISQMAEKGQKAAALERINTYLKANPKDAQGMFTKGIIQAESGLSKEAIKTFTDLTQQYPNLPEPYNNLAVLHAEAGQYNLAKKALQTAIKTHPSYATAHENLGDIYARMASEAYDKALTLDNGNTRAQSKLSLIKDLFGTGSKTTIAAKTKPIRPADKKTAALKPAPVEATPTPVDTTANDESDIADAVSNWANVWSSQDLEGYYASYAETFKPARGRSYASWKKLRKDRVTRPSKINLELNDQEISVIDDSNAKVRFKQYYKADGGPIRTFKTLVLKKIDGAWLINQEIASN